MKSAAKFTMIDEQFECLVCNYNVEKLGYSARNHCPKCLSSKHVDNNPGDRLSDCHGILVPIAIEPSKKDTYKIVHSCNTCNVIKRNVTASDDNMELIIKIISNPIDTH